MNFSSFSEIAAIYDRFNDLSIYEHWLDFTLNSLDHPPTKALDVATGTGMFAQLLAPFVKEVDAVDIDPGMLSIAKEASGTTPGLNFEHADMLDLSLYDSDYDLVTCYTDSLCFLDSFDEVVLALQEMYDRLKTGGTLLFDVWSPYMLEEGFTDFSYFDTDPTAALMWDSEIHGEQLMVDHYLTVFSKESHQDCYQRREVHLRERTYPVQQIVQALTDIGFERIEVLTDFGEKIYHPQKDEAVDRIFYRCMK